jgi:NAD(P)-dependent dehydrogenase (short-subunit alcohol dehydrogenase family)
MGRLTEKVAIITGATSGMGRRTSECFVEEGARVVVCGRRVELGRDLEAKLGRNRCLFVEVDVTDEDDVKRLVADCIAEWGRVDCLFNNAGSAITDDGIETITVKDFDATISTILRSVMLGMKHIAPIMKDQGSGSIINSGSVAGRRAGYSGSLIYGAAKAAVLHLTRCVAMQLGEHNIRVNSISPGAIATGMFAKDFGISSDRVESTVEMVKTLFARAQPIQRSGLPDDIAQAAVFLACDESNFVNGHDLVVDGGMTGGRLWSVQRQGRQAMRDALQGAT